MIRFGSMCFEYAISGNLRVFHVNQENCLLVEREDVPDFFRGVMKSWEQAGSIPLHLLESIRQGLQATECKGESIYERPIEGHGGAKYLRRMIPADGKGSPISVDVYAVIEAFGITCPALQHALKKILACGQRGKGGKIADIEGAMDAMWRARELQIQREKDDGSPRKAT